MLLVNSGFRLTLTFLLAGILFGVVSAQEENVDAAEELMVFQLEALKAKDRKKFVANANRAFRELMDEYMFDSLVMQRHNKVIKGYKLEYLGSIRTIGTLEYLWKIHFTDDKYQALGRLSVSQGKVIGFGLE